MHETSIIVKISVQLIDGIVFVGGLKLNKRK
jgi:hypothetical protein